jgi:DinB superfamily
MKSAKLIAMAEDFPEAKHDFKPKPGARSFAERLIHAAAANYFFTNLVVGQKLSSEEEPKRDQFKNRAELVAYVKKSFADGPGESEKSVLVPRFFLRFALLDVP